MTIDWSWVSIACNGNRANTTSFYIHVNKNVQIARLGCKYYKKTTGIQSQTEIDGYSSARELCGHSCEHLGHPITLNLADIKK